jgi:hypothetical protein
MGLEVAAHSSNFLSLSPQLTLPKTNEPFLAQ